MFHAVNQALGGHDTLTASVNRRRALLTYRGTRTEARLEQDFTALRAMDGHGFSPQELNAIAHGLTPQRAVRQYYQRLSHARMW